MCDITYVGTLEEQCETEVASRKKSILDWRNLFEIKSITLYVDSLMLDLKFDYKNPQRSGKHPILLIKPPNLVIYLASGYLTRTLAVQLQRYACGTAPRGRFALFLSRTRLTYRRLVICPTRFVKNFFAVLLVVSVCLQVVE